MSDILKLAALGAAAYAGLRLLNKEEEPNAFPPSYPQGPSTGPSPIGMSAPYIALIMQGDAVWYNSTAPGGVLDIDGTPERPCNTPAQVRTLLAARNLAKVVIMDTFALDADMPDLTFIGVKMSIAGTMAVFDPAGFSCDNCDFYNLQIQGVANVATIDSIRLFDCRCAIPVNPLNIQAWRTQFGTATTLFIGTYEYIWGSYFGSAAAYPIFNFSTSAICRVQLENISGNITLLNMKNAANIVNVSGTGTLNVGVSCVAGTITVYGDIHIVGGAGGVTIVDRTNWSVLGSLLASNARLELSDWIVFGTVNDGAPGADDFDTSLTEATDDHYNGATLLFTTGANKGQYRTIQDYTGGTKNVDFNAFYPGDFIGAPANGDAFVIIPAADGWAFNYLLGSLTAARIGALDNLVTATFKGLITFTQQARVDSGITPPVQNTWYTILDTTNNVHIYMLNVAINTTGETLQLRMTIDGQVWTRNFTATAGIYYYILHGIDEPLFSSYDNDMNGRDFEAKSIKIEVRKTTANGVGQLEWHCSFGKL